MDLVTDHARTRTGSGERGRVAIPPAAAELLIAAFGALLYRYTGEPDVTLDVDLSGRGRGSLRLHVDPREPFAALVARARTAPLDPPATGDVTLHIGQAAGLDYAADLFDRSTVERMGRHLDRLRTAADVSADLLDEGERHRILRVFNDTARPYPRDAAIHRLVEEQARRTPGALAVSHASGRLTYRELDERADLVAARLRTAGVRPGQPVGLRLARTPELVVATVGILKAGGAYLPIDPAYPADRVAFLLADSGAAAVVTTGLAVAARPAAGEPIDGDPAYVMYTSGTTGRPKGVVVGHRGVVRLVRNPDYLAFSAGTRVLAVGSICFDAATFELWAALLNGGSVHLADGDVALTAPALRRVLADEAITTMLLITPVFNQLVDQDPTVLRPLRQLIVGGDRLSASHVALALDACPDLVLLNGYGPTENTVLGTAHRLTRADGGRIPIGRPVANSTAYVLDPDGRLCPIGVPGELCLGGDGVALGYLNRPELTAASFAPDPFRPGGRLYRTGDIARWRPDGVLEFFGRRDRQVKVRGVRVEPGEIEHALVGHPSVREAAVVARTRPDGTGRYLCAYYVGDVPGDELRGYLRRTLPDPMLPSAFVAVPVLPLGDRGKLDEAQLPVPSHVDGPAPDDPIEAALVRLAAGSVGVASVGVDDDLRDLGADSLTAALLAIGVTGELGVRLAADHLLRAGTVRRIAAQVRAAAVSTAPRVPAAPDADTYPLTPQQRRVYVEQAKHPGAVHYHVPVTVAVPPGAVPGRVAEALARLADRHEALRTEFVLAGDEVRQRFAPAVVPDMSTVDGPFALDRAPLWRAAFDGGSLHLDLHHLVTDGVSLSVLAEELADLCAGRALPPPVGLRYRDFAAWTASEAGQAWRRDQGAFWRTALADLPPRRDLPLDAPRPALRAPDGGEVACDLGAARTAALRALARRADVTLFAVLAAAYTALLAALTGDPDVTVGTPASGRTVPGLDRTVGLLATTVCLRGYAEPRQRFDAYLRQIAGFARDAFAHQDFGWEDLVAARDYRRNPLFDAYVAVHSGRYLRGLRPGWNGQTPFDLNLQVYAEAGTLRASWQYGSRILRPDTVAGWRDRYLALLDAVVADPTVRLDELPVGRPRVPVPDLDFDI